MILYNNVDGDWGDRISFIRISLFYIQILLFPTEEAANISNKKSNRIESKRKLFVIRRLSVTCGRNDYHIRNTEIALKKKTFTPRATNTTKPTLN